MFRKRGGSGAWWVLLAGLLWVSGLVAREAPAPQLDAVTQVVAVAALPVQGQQVLQQIHQGGPFRYDKDGTVFGNRERLLPRQARGYYREYTVPTPGLNHRGARRIVCGGNQPKAPEACYYTADHYTSFKRIVQ
jgi:ribonuclease T1